MTTDGDIWSSMSWPAGWDVRHVAETGSTNADLVDAVVAGTARDRTVLATDHQTAGRGRLDRRWDAPPGANLLVSIVVSPVPLVAADATHRVGLAAVAAVDRLVDPGGADDPAPDSRRRPGRAVHRVGLKWPNDVLLGERKLAGILAQRVPDRDAVVVGLGLNVGWAPEGAAKIGDLPGGESVTPARVLQALLEELDALPDDIATRYRDSLVTIGQSVRIDLPGDVAPLEGHALDVDAQGRLVVMDAGGLRHALDAGDVVHLRTAGGDVHLRSSGEHHGG